MATPPVVHIVCSDRHRNGKTLLARVLVDYLMLDGRDPFVIDAGFPDGPLRNYFPGRTALVDFETIPGQMKLFDTILGSPGRDYVIDLPSGQTENFFKASGELGFIGEARHQGFKIVVLFVVDQTPDSLKTAKTLEAGAQPDAMVLVRNGFVGSTLVDISHRIVIDMPELDAHIAAFAGTRRFSFRGFLLDDDQDLPAGQKTKLKTFLYEMMTGLRDIGPATTLRALRN
ncbi:MAG: hypothetical protein H7X89_04485 [Rhizobiales bacterium]|nr:hypothetical protein [Hyphomicrobiales bacterium]